MKFRHFFNAALLVVLSAVPAFAQQPIFSVSTQAVGIHLGGQTVAGTDAVGSFNLTKNIVLQTDNILAPANDFQGYYGGVRYNFNLTSLISKTTIPPGMFQPYVHAAAGVVRNVPASGPSAQSIGAMADFGVDFDLTKSGKFMAGPRVGYLYAPGFGSSPHGVMVSANLTIVLGSK